jgi:hypothetical protein
LPKPRLLAARPASSFRTPSRGLLQALASLASSPPADAQPAHDEGLVP